MKYSKYLTGGIGVVLIFILIFILSKCNTCKTAKEPKMAEVISVK